MHRVSQSLWSCAGIRSKALVTRTSQIPLNVDMRVAIPRRQTQHPTIDDVVNELNGSTVFSHLDMNKGYHQLKFKESSQNVTTF